MNVEDLPALIDAAYTATQARLALSKEVDKLKEEEKRTKAALIEVLKYTGMSGAASASAKVTFKEVAKPAVTDWAELYQHIAETGNFDLLQRRVGEAAVKLRWEDGEAVPGIVSYPVEKLTLTKVKL